MFQQILLHLHDLFQCLSNRHPGTQDRVTVPRHGDGVANDTVHRPLCNGIPRKLPIFGIAPGPFGPAKAFLPTGIPGQPCSVFRYTGPDFPGKEKIAVTFIVHHGIGGRVIKCCIPNVALIDP